MAVAYRELIGTAQEIGHSEHMRMRQSIRQAGVAIDRHGFTWRSLGVTTTTTADGRVVAVVDEISWTDFTFGVELELAAPVADRDVQRRLPSGWRVVHDGSVHADRGLYPMEVVSPILQGQPGIAAMKEVMDLLKAMGCKVNSSCGMHVHVGVRGMQPSKVRKIAIAFLNSERHFDALVPPQRRSNRYAQSNLGVFRGENERLMNATSISTLANVMNGGSSSARYNSFRYYKLNFQSFVQHGTIEFRQHAGSVESDKATAWVRMVTGFCARAAAQAQQTIGASESFEQWIASVTDEAGARYMTARRAKFAAATRRAA